MSRGDFGYGSTSRGYRDNPDGRDYRDNPFGSMHEEQGAYNASVDTISTNLFTINNNATTLERSMTQIGTDKDSKLLRDRIHDAEQATNRVINDTAKELRRFSQICTRGGREQKLQYQRLKEEFRVSAERYNSFQKIVAEKVKSSVLLTSKKTQRVGKLIDWGEDGDDEEKLMEHEQRRQQMLAQEEALESDVAMLEEREDQVRQLESDILDINEIFRDLGTLVHEQGATIDSIEDNVVKAADNVEAGNEQLQRASIYQMKSRKKLCILVAIVVVVVAIIITVIVLSVKH